MELSLEILVAFELFARRTNTIILYPLTSDPYSLYPPPMFGVCLTHFRFFCPYTCELSMEADADR